MINKQDIQPFNDLNAGLANSSAVLPANIMCFSHLRWKFVYQRPQHLLSRFSTRFNVFYLEEPVYDSEGPNGYLAFINASPTLHILVSHLPSGITGEETDTLQRKLIDGFLAGRALKDFIFWYYTPMALSFTDHLTPACTIYDCMDQLSAFKDAPVQLLQREQALFKLASIVFTGGYSLFQAKRSKHPFVYLFPSSIEKDHFALARVRGPQQPDQARIGKPIIGYFGVIDERFDVELIKNIALARPDWNIVLIGPVVKISEDSIPTLPNIHMLGQRSYKQLPSYLRDWDVAIIPFLLNESTRYISPTKTPEYLAAGIPVVSTPIHDVAYEYGANNCVKIEKDASGFLKAIQEFLDRSPKAYSTWLKAVDALLELQSWDKTYSEMLTQLKLVFVRNAAASKPAKETNIKSMYK